MIGRVADWDRDLLQELLWAYGPCGQESAVRDVVRRELAPLADETWVDAAGNLVGLIRGADGSADVPGADGGPAPIRVTAHLDELSMLVKRVEPDGSLHVTPLGVMYPANFGLGPVAVLGDHETLTAVLSLGSEHTTRESQRIWQTKPDQGDQALDWLHVYVFTGRTPDELTAAGVRPGTRVCVDRTKRTLVDVGDFLGAYFMDDRASIATVLHAAHLLRESGRPPAGDVYLVFTTNEEIGGVGASYASRTLPGDLTLAVEVGPAEPEYGTTVTGGPVVAYADSAGVYDKEVCDALMATAARLHLEPQAAVLGALESDASQSKSKGLSPRAGMLCLATLSTHGYEVISRDAVPDTAAVLAEYLVGRAGR
jgi:putative aminopeptidase FrvX